MLGDMSLLGGRDAVCQVIQTTFARIISIEQLRNQDDFRMLARHPLLRALKKIF